MQYNLKLKIHVFCRPIFYFYDYLFLLMAISSIFLLCNSSFLPEDLTKINNNIIKGKLIPFILFIKKSIFKDCHLMCDVIKHYISKTTSCISLSFPAFSFTMSSVLCKDLQYKRTILIVIVKKNFFKKGTSVKYLQFI